VKAFKIIYLTDPHWRGTSPRARTDNYQEAIDTKLREVFDLAAELADTHGVIIVCGGDLLDSPDAAYSVSGDLAVLLAQAPCPFYVCPGNHEIYGYNLDTLPRTVLGFLARVGLVELLTRDPVLVADEWLFNFSVYLTGQGFHHDMDRTGRDYLVERIEDGLTSKIYHVHVVHGMLVERPLPYEVAHTIVKDCKTNADVILSGHEHLGYGLIKRADGVWFCNPGALGRVSAKVEEMHRRIQVAVFTFTEDGIFAELVPLKSARPGHEVLSRDHLIQAAEREERTAAFLALLAEDRETRLLDTREIINHVADSEALPEPVRVEALNRLGKARELLLV
jgi:DNA repair exonuclease SbcCD nuclease subunit